MDGIKILAEITLRDMKRTMGEDVQFSPHHGWHLSKEIHTLDNKPNDDSTTNDEPSPFLEHSNSIA